MKKNIGEADDEFLIRISRNRAKYEREKNMKPPLSALINEISRLFMIAVRQNGEEGAMKFSRSFILKYLAHGDGVTQSSIVNFSHLRAPTVSAELALMEREGLVKRRKNENDGREILVFLTEKGRKTDNDIRKSFEKTEKVMTASLGERETDELFSYLTSLRDNILDYADKKGETDNL